MLIVGSSYATEIDNEEFTTEFYLSYDLDNSSIMYSKNIDDKISQASLTKLMTAPTGSKINRCWRERHCGTGRRKSPAVGPYFLVSNAASYWRLDLLHAAYAVWWWTGDGLWKVKGQATHREIRPCNF